MVDTPGLTWYELYLLAAACTPRPRSLISSTSAQPAKNITFLLRKFAVETMRLVKFAVQTQYHPYFLASQSATNRMQAYGVWNRPQHTSVMVRLNSDAFAALDKALLNMTSTLTKNQRDSLAAGTFQVKMRKFHGFTTVKCVSQLDTLMQLRTSVEWANPKSEEHSYFCTEGHAKNATTPFSLYSPHKLIWCSSCRKGLVGANWKCTCGKVWYNCPIHQPLVDDDLRVQCTVRPRAKPRANSAAASARSLEQIEPETVSRPIIGPTLQRRFRQLRALVSPTLLAAASSHEAPGNLHSSQPSSPYSSRTPDDDPNHDLVPKAETNNQREADEDGNGLERTTADSAVSPAVPAALAAPLLPAAPAELSRAAAASAPRKQRRPFNILRT